MQRNTFHSIKEENIFNKGKQVLSNKRRKMSIKKAIEILRLGFLHLVNAFISTCTVKLISQSI